MTRIITSIIFLATVAFGAFPQAMYIESAKVGGTTAKPEPAVTENPVVATPTATSPAIKVAKLKTDSAAFAPRSLEELDAYLDSIKYIPCDTLVGTLPLPQYFFRPLVLTTTGIRRNGTRSHPTFQASRRCAGLKSR